jgi:hypothetical protein
MLKHQVTYSVWGNCKAKGFDNTVTDFVSIHAWGVNFESKHAIDSELILNTKNKNHVESIVSQDILNSFYQMSKRMWISIIQAGIDSQIQSTNTSTLVILTPAIGCGAYLSYITSLYDTKFPQKATKRKHLGDKFWDDPINGLTLEELSVLEALHTETYNFIYMRCIFKALNDTIKENHVNMKKYNVVMRVVLQTKERNTCMAFEKSVQENTLLKRAKCCNGTTLDNLFTPLQCIDVSKDGKNVLQTRKLGVVNAWDTFSWIGNGGSRDASVDGFYVAGWLAGKTFVNNSYLLNAQYANNFR